MDKKLCQFALDSQSSSFKLYLRTFFPCEIISLMDELAQQVDIYVFSGVIKSFLLGFLEHRDLDLVVGSTDKIKVPVGKLLNLGLRAIRRNKFNGIKLVFNNLDVDIWRIQDTRGIIEQQFTPSAYNLIKTSFFNFSAIVYDYRSSKFIFGDDFCHFWLTHELDVVYEENAFVESCIVSTLYYAERYDLSISQKLCKWLAKRINPEMKFQDCQKRRFGKVLFSNYVIQELGVILKDNPNLRIHNILLRGKNLLVDCSNVTQTYHLIYSIRNL